MLEVSELNFKSSDRFRFFELGRSYLSDDLNYSKEALQFGAAFFDKEKNCFLDLTNTISNLLSSLNLSFEFVERNEKFQNPLFPKDWMGAHPFEYSNIRIHGKFVGAIFSVHPLLLRNFKIKGSLSYCILDLSIFDNMKLKDKTKYKPLNKFPTSSFDWTVTMPSYSSIVEAINAAKKVKLNELKSVEILDIFQQVNQKYVTLRATLADECATLNPELLKKAELSLIDATNKAGFILK